MARLLFLLSRSTDDPDYAATVLDAAAEAAEAGHDVAIWLSGEGVRLGVKGVADAIRVRDLRPAADSVAILSQRGAAVYVSTACFRKRKFEDDALLANATCAGPSELASLVADGWRPLTL